MRVIGIDPGLRNLGWGVIDVAGSRLTHVANGICHSDATTGDLARRLASLHFQLTRVFQDWQPETAAVEHTFVNKDAVATLKLGQARGIALLVPAQFGLEVGEYAPNAVKKTVVGSAMPLNNRWIIWCGCICRARRWRGRMRRMRLRSRSATPITRKARAGCRRP